MMGICSSGLLSVRIVDEHASASEIHTQVSHLHHSQAATLLSKTARSPHQSVAVQSSTTNNVTLPMHRTTKSTRWATTAKADENDMIVMSTRCGPIRHTFLRMPFSSATHLGVMSCRTSKKRSPAHICPCCCLEMWMLSRRADNSDARQCRGFSRFRGLESP